MKKMYALAILCLIITSAYAQFDVTLKVIDNQDGALTNNVNDNNETNVFVWAGKVGGNQIYTRPDGDWWYAIYSGDVNCPTGSLIKDNGVWTWQATFNVGEGDYEWNPHMKTIQWKSINTIYNYGTSDNLLFSVDAQGVVSGQTTLSLPLVATAIIKNEKALQIQAQGKSIRITDAQGQSISVFNLSGQIIHSGVANSGSQVISAPQSGLYIVKVGDRTQKVSIR